MSIDYDAELRDAIEIDGYYLGDIFHDKKERFRDGEFVRTSAAVKTAYIDEELYVTTTSGTIYKVTLVS